MKSLKWLVAFCFIVALLSQAPPVPAATLLKTDFNQAEPRVWPRATASATPVRAFSVTVARGLAGTVDVVNTDTPSVALLLTARGLPVSPNSKVPRWSAVLQSGLLAVANTETNLGKLTLAFSLSASSASPVTVRVESFNAARQRTGGLTGQIFPAAPDFFQRYALDLSTLKPVGAGQFRPNDSFVQFTFESDSAKSGGAPWPASGKYQLRLDNVHYATPALYVSPSGSNSKNGRSEQDAFATVQKALDLAQPGDIILLMAGTHQAGQASVATFRRAGTPDAWITLKNYPGHTPLLTSTGWNIVALSAGYPGNISNTTLAYLEVRGLHVRSEGDVARTKYPDAMNKADSRTNSNGISIDGRYMTNVPHHIRVADNVVEYCPGCGISVLEGDWVTFENNISRFNSWTTIYATSGISVLGASNFDATENVYKHLVRNNICYRNETFEKWKQIDKYSDGNGIILDMNFNTTMHPTGAFKGRTLVQSNLCFDNGGSGIHSYKANRVDIIHNTAYFNSASVHLEYPQIFANSGTDVRIMNNILVAPVANTAAGQKPESVNSRPGNATLIYSNNLYFGGNTAPFLGTGDVVGDPKFINPTRDGAVADFRLLRSSPAVSTGASGVSFAPFLDLDGKPRQWRTPSKGAYER